MHTIHYIAVTAASKEEAFDKVCSALEPSDEGYRACDWSDWHVVGGGRWNSEGSQYNDSSSDVISYKDNPDKYNETISLVRKWKSEEAHRALEIDFDMVKSDIVDYISNGGELPDDRRYDLGRYTLRGVLSLLNGYWTPDSHFFDLEWGSSDFHGLQERLDNSEVNGLEYLVPVDFHY